MRNLFGKLEIKINNMNPPYAGIRKRDWKGGGGAGFREKRKEDEGVRTIEEQPLNEELLERFRKGGKGLANAWDKKGIEAGGTIKGGILHEKLGPWAFPGIQ